MCISHLFLLKKTQCGSYVNHCHKRNYAQENNDGWKMGNFHPETLTLYNWHLVCFLKRCISVLKENSITTKLVGKVMFKILVMVLKKNLLIKGPFGAGFSSKRKVSSRGHVHAHRGALKDNRWRCRPWLKLNYSVYVLLAVATQYKAHYYISCLSKDHSLWLSSSYTVCLIHLIVSGYGKQICQMVVHNQHFIQMYPHIRLSLASRSLKQDTYSSDRQVIISWSDMLQTESLYRSFLSAYAEIDLHRRGFITHADLNKFAENAGLPESFAEVMRLHCCFLNYHS